MAASRVVRLKDLRTLTPARRLSRYARTDNPATPATTPASPTSNSSGGVEEINVPASTTNPPNIAIRRLNPATPWNGAAGRLCTNALSPCPDHPEIWTRGRALTSSSPWLRVVQAFAGSGLLTMPRSDDGDQQAGERVEITVARPLARLCARFTATHCPRRVPNQTKEKLGGQIGGQDSH